MVAPASATSLLKLSWAAITSPNVASPPSAYADSLSTIPMKYLGMGHISSAVRTGRHRYHDAHCRDEAAAQNSTRSVWNHETCPRRFEHVHFGSVRRRIARPSDADPAERVRRSCLSRLRAGPG